MAKIYLASSWRNQVQPQILGLLRHLGHEVYDFRNPKEGDTSFSWKSVDGGWESWTPEQYREALKHPIAQAGYTNDINALRWCEICVLLLPSGRSASWEFGYAMGQGKLGYVIMLEKCEPELMYFEATILKSIEEIAEAFYIPVYPVRQPHHCGKCYGFHHPDAICQA